MGVVGMDQPRFTRLSKVLAVVLLVLFAAAFLAPSSRAYLCLVPGRTLPCVWNLLTAGFVSTSIVEVLVAVVSLLLLARIIEPVYGSTEFLKFILVVELVSSFSTFILAYFIFMTAPYSAKGKTLYTEFSGFHGILSAMLVAVKQIMPHQEVILGGAVRLSARYVPSVYVLLSTVVIVALQQWSALPFLYLGTYSSWVYLRFFQQQPESTACGDPSEDFKFSSFFPDFLAGPIDFVGSIMARVTRLQHGANPDTKPLLPLVSTALGSNSADANRRRERGARALEERLEMKKVAEAPLVESAAIAAAAAAASSLPDVGAPGQQA